MEGFQLERDWIRWSNDTIKKPDNGTVFEVITYDGRETDAYFNENWQRTALMIRGTDGLFWREMLHVPTHWRHKV